MQERHLFNAYMAMRKYQKAIADFTSCLAIYPMHANAYSQRGYACMTMGELQHSIPDLTKSIELNPFNARTYYRRGTAYVGMKEHKLVTADMERVVMLSSDPELVEMAKELIRAAENKVLDTSIKSSR